jgi:hypothetical protein
MEKLPMNTMLLVFLAAFWGGLWDLYQSMIGVL